MHCSLKIFGVLVLVFHVGHCQLPSGGLIPAINAGSQAMNLLPPGARDCVNKVTTKAVSDSLISKLAGAAGSIFGGAAPTITRDPGQFECKNGKPYYKETAHLKAQLSFLGNTPIDFPLTTETDLSSCFKDGLPNPCTVATGLFGSNGGNVLNGALGSNRPNPQPTIGGKALGGGTSNNPNPPPNGLASLGQLFQKG